MLRSFSRNKAIINPLVDAGTELSTLKRRSFGQHLDDGQKARPRIKKIECDFRKSNNTHRSTNPNLDTLELIEIQNFY